MSTKTRRCEPQEWGQKAGNSHNRRLHGYELSSFLALTSGDGGEGCFGPVIVSAVKYRSGLSFAWMVQFVSSPSNPNLLKWGERLCFQKYRSRIYREWLRGNLMNLWTERRHYEMKREDQRREDQRDCMRRVQKVQDCNRGQKDSRKDHQKKWRGNLNLFEMRWEDLKGARL